MVWVELVAIAFAGSFEVVVEAVGVYGVRSTGERSLGSTIVFEFFIL